MFEKVLIIDDEKLIADAISDYLTKLKITSRVEVTPKAAIKSFAENPADLIIVDYKFSSLSGKTGLDVIHQIRSHKPTTRIILISGLLPFDPNNQEVLIAKVKVDRYFQKPFNTVDLGKAVEELLHDVAGDSSNWESIAKNYVEKTEISSHEIRLINDEFKKAIIKNLREDS